MDQEQGPITFTVSDPCEPSRYEVGDRLVFAAPPLRWWRRLWRWIRRGFRRAPPPPILTVVAVNQDAGVITVDRIP